MANVAALIAPEEDAEFPRIKPAVRWTSIASCHVPPAPPGPGPR
jgi:hypothetical protein